MPRITNIRLLYFLTFAIFGAWLPFLPLYLTSELQWSEQHVGWLLALSSLSIMFTPALMTLLADMHFQPRRLIMVINLLGCASFLALSQIESFWPFMFVFVFYSLVSAPLVSLQDGLFFGYSKSHPDTAPPFHRIRVFGTIGFIFPSIIMFVLLKYGMHISVMMKLAAGICFLGAVNTLLLPNVQREPRQSNRLPTREALTAMRQKHVLYFCAGLWLMHNVSAAFYAFHPVWLRDVVMLDDKWVGLMANLGVTVEIFFMLAFGFMLHHLGLRKLMVIGMLLTAVRMAILAFTSSLPLVVFSQFFHGMMVLIVHVAPPVFLNANARQSFRSSIQGLFAMGIAGTGRVVGNLVAGYLAQINLKVLYSYCIMLCLLAAIVIFWGLRHWDMYAATDAKADDPVDDLKASESELLESPAER
ncbi:MAG: MFS transporter [Phycisphaeraceae bacterium JB051]